jgi:hypothetical protein
MECKENNTSSAIFGNKVSGTVGGDKFDLNAPTIT